MKNLKLKNVNFEGCCLFDDFCCHPIPSIQINIKLVLKSKTKVVDSCHVIVCLFQMDVTVQKTLAFVLSLNIKIKQKAA